MNQDIIGMNDEYKRTGAEKYFSTKLLISGYMKNNSGGFWSVIRLYI